MKKIFGFITDNPKTVISAILIVSAIGAHVWKNLAVDVFPDVSIPRVTIQTEAGGLTAEEVEELVTIPIESEVSAIPGVSTVRSSSSGGLSFVWIDFDWNTDINRARFNVFERLERIKGSLPAQARAEITPVVSVTGEIMLVALTREKEAIGMMELREIAEYDLRTRLLSIPGIGEVTVIGGRLPEYRIAADPRRIAQYDLSLADIIEAARDTRTYLSAGYLANVGGDEVPLRQIARADTLSSIKNSPIPRANGGSLRIGDVADVSVAGEPRRGSASFNGSDAVVISIQKTPGGNTPELTEKVDAAIAEFAETVKSKGVKVHADAYRQSDFIDASVKGGGQVVKDAVIIVVAVLLITLLEVRTILVVLCTMPVSILLGLSLFPLLGLGVNIMTLGGMAVAAGDIVDGAIIFTEAIRRKLGENAAMPAAERRSAAEVICDAASSVAPGVLFSATIVILLFIPLLMLSGLEGRFFAPLALSYIAVFSMSLVAAFTMTSALAMILRLDKARWKSSAKTADAGLSPGIKLMRRAYRPALHFALNFPKTVLLVALIATGYAVHTAIGFGKSFLPPFREDSFNVMLSLPPGASLAETERISESAVPAIVSIPGVKSVTRRTGRAERDQHAEPVSSSEFVVRVDLNGDTDAVRDQIRRRLGDIPGCALIVGYPIAHRISAVLSGTEAELAVNIFGENADVLRETAKKMKSELETIKSVADVRANREITVRTFRIEYDMSALTESGITLREAGEQVSAAFNGAEVGEVRDSIRRRAVTVRLAGDENRLGPDEVKKLIISGRSGKRVRLDDIARITPEDAPNLMLREGGRRKALISCNPADGISAGELVDELRARLGPIAAAAGCSVSFGGSYQARESAGRRIALIGSALVAVVFFILVFALGSARAAALSLINIPLGLIGSVAAVSLAEPVLSVSSLVGFVTVIGFVLRNGILLINSYSEKMKLGASLSEAIAKGSEERMAPIVMTSLTTVIGLVPIMIAGSKPGGELLSPLAIVQFGGLLAATALNLIVLPAATKAMGLKKPVLPAVLAVTLSCGCSSYEPKPIDWEAESRTGTTNNLFISSVEDAAMIALSGNRELNAKRLKAANTDAIARETGWWEDPEFDFDFMRILNPSDNPFLGGGSIAFTLPLSGAPALEKRAAQAYAKADADEIRAAEREVATKARKLAIRLDSLRARREMLLKWNSDKRAQKARSDVESLHKAGEASSSDLANVHRKMHILRHDIMENEKETAATEIAFLSLSGLRPGTRICVDLGETEMPKRPDEKDDPVDLVKHPRVAAALARFGGTELNLHAEINRQYPDLKLGPAYVNEEGLDRFGLVAGFTIPLWNRNRKGIAEAGGARDEARLDAIDTWRSLVYEAAEARENLIRLLDHPPAPASERKQADYLLDAGELSPMEYLSVRGEIVDFELAHADWRRDVALAAAELEKFNVKRQAASKGKQ